ncbi:hypothetical protein LX13_000697 [Williamsia maris]|uniref:Uncharacterized protein n=2 Tax=Williamsia maris TaxID=72806 RepID=A0ABT1HAW7_9NOCA|nr:hypothetical protein [Williamsia maris]
MPCSTVIGMPGQPGDRLLYAALVLFAVGVVAIITMFAYPALADGDRAPIGVYLLTLGTPIGFVLAIVFALRSGRRQR